jgi:CheY-like chemotaxis protein
MPNPLNVLVVEDNVINQKVVIKMLERLQLHADVAVNGKAAVTMFTALPYDLVFMDIQMPEMDGLEATRQIRQSGPQGAGAVIIALTANAMQGDRERCLQAGMDDYLAKPIKQSDLEGIIVKWFPVLAEQETPPPQAASPAQDLLIDPKRIEQIQDIGENELLKELLTLYLDDLDQFAQCIPAAVAEGNFRQVYECSHKLKGSSANLGIESIREACKTMESIVHRNDADGITVHFTEMQRLMETIRRHITRTYL